MSELKVREELKQRLCGVLQGFSFVTQAVIFGSMAKGRETSESDIDLAVRGTGILTQDQKESLIEALTLAFDRPVDVVDLMTIGQPLLDQIISHGQQVIGSSSQWGDLVYRNIVDQEDLVPHQQRILEGRRKAWINS